MSKYAQEAKEVAEKIELFAAQHKLDNTAKADLANLAFMSAKAMPWRGANFALKVNFASIVGQYLKGVDAKRVEREGRDGGKYETVIYEPKGNNPFDQ